MVQTWYLATKRSQRGTERGRCPLCAEETESHRIPSIVEMPREAEVNKGAPESQILEYQLENSTRGDTHCKHFQ
jgi:hypothetical protein